MQGNCNIYNFLFGSCNRPVRYALPSCGSFTGRIYIATPPLQGASATCASQPLQKVAITVGPHLVSQLWLGIDMKKEQGSGASFFICCFCLASFVPFCSL